MSLGTTTLDNKTSITVNFMASDIRGSRVLENSMSPRVIDASRAVIYKILH